MKEERSNKLDRLLQIRAPESLTDALDKAAGQRLVSRSGYIRAALVEKLRSDGAAPSGAVA